MQPLTDTAKLRLREAARHTRLRCMRAALVVAAVVGALAYAVAEKIAAQGVALGGLAGALGFWAMSLRLEQIALVKPERLAVAATVWTFYRILIYGVFLAVAYRLDRENYFGLFGALAGLLSTRVAITAVGIVQARAAQTRTEPRR